MLIWGASVLSLWSKGGAITLVGDSGFPLKWCSWIDRQSYLIVLIYCPTDAPKFAAATAAAIALSVTVCSINQFLMGINFRWQCQHFMAFCFWSALELAGCSCLLAKRRVRAFRAILTNVQPNHTLLVYRGWKGSFEFDLISSSTEIPTIAFANSERLSTVGSTCFQVTWVP